MYFVLNEKRFSLFYTISAQNAQNCFIPHTTVLPFLTFFSYTKQAILTNFENWLKTVRTLFYVHKKVSLPLRLFLADEKASFVAEIALE